jgi:malate synthase
MSLMVVEVFMSFIKLHDSVSFPEKFWIQEYRKLFPQNLLNIVSDLHKKFNNRRLELLKDRDERQKVYDKGALPDFLTKDSIAVSGDWKVSPIPEELLCRRVEITGPVNSAKMVINMLSRSDDGLRADMAMLDFEDSMKPSFTNVLDGYNNVIGAVEGSLSTTVGDKTYKLNPEDKAYVMVRVRGLHLQENNFTIDNEPVSGGLLDLAVCFYHTAHLYRKQNITPKYYVPKCEHYLEARWWNEVFCELEKAMNLEVPTLRATFLIETLPATFQVEEILYEIREHAAGLNVGRWDKIFSDIKILRNYPDRIIADRSYINMDRQWMENYAKRVIKICHDRGAFAMGGMSAFTPGKTPELRKEQSQKVFNDKQREANWGHDGCWVSHPYFIGIAMEAMNFKNQLDRKISFNKYSDILPTSEGPHTLHGLRTNIRVGIAYMHGWNSDIGCVAFDNLMEDLATLEISRAQTWQWMHHELKLDDGMTVTKDLVSTIFEEEYQKILEEMIMDKSKEEQRKIEMDLLEAKKDALRIFTKDKLDEFLTLGSRPV